MIVTVGAPINLDTYWRRPTRFSQLAPHGANVEFFWAGPDDGYGANRSVRRTLSAANKVQQYLFRIGSGAPVQKLRFDPLQNQGELRIESITLYKTTK